MSYDAPTPPNVVDGVLMCKTCGEPSRSDGGEVTTLLGFALATQDCPLGLAHDPNCKTRLYFCQNGHSEPVQAVNKCECGWRGKIRCFCWAGGTIDKLEEWPKNPTLRTGFSA